MKSGLEETVLLAGSNHTWIGVLFLGAFGLAIILVISFEKWMSRFQPDALVRCGWLTMTPLGRIDGQAVANIAADPARLPRFVIWGPPVRPSTHPGTWLLGQVARSMTVLTAVGILVLLGSIVLSDADAEVRIFLGFWIALAFGSPGWSGRRRWPKKLRLEDVRQRHRWDRPLGNFADPTASGA